MSEDPASGLLVGVVAVLAGAVVTWFWARHRKRMASAERAREHVPKLDARGWLLFLNGPVTIAIGLGVLAASAVAWRARERVLAQHRELESVHITCTRDGSLAMTLDGGSSAREVALEDAEVMTSLVAKNARVHFTPDAHVVLQPGEPMTFRFPTPSAELCGQPPSTFVEPMGIEALFAGDAPPRGDGRACSGLAYTLIVRTADGDELARATGECWFETGAIHRLGQLGVRPRPDGIALRSP